MNEKNRIEKLQAALDRAVASGEECGCQLAVFRDGKMLCNLVSGYADAAHTRKVDTRTLFPVFSVGKGILTTLFHILSEKGFISPDDPVVRHWPEYGVRGKEKTRVRDILSHRGGLYGFPDGFPFPEWFDWEKAASALAGSEVFDRIGGKHHYHAHTYGVLLGRLLEKATGRSVTDLLREHLLDVLSVDSMFFSLPDERLGDLAEIVPRADGPGDPPDMRLSFNDRRVLQGLNPSSSMTSNAVSIARVYAALIGNGVDGRRLLTDATLEKALTMQRAADDPASRDQWDIFGLGYALCGPVAPWNRMFGHGGACGSEGFADRETGYAVGFTKNRLNATHPDHPTRNEISRILGIPARIW
ncbi:MAG: beta-lactamase family protein [Victivallaceae bacterium]|nr:beta-lactamase family protein [Victivallaceae bacterium]